MPRLIDADKAYKSIMKYTNNQHGIGIKEALNRVPTVDAEPVVRCKDCIHYWKNNPSDDVLVCLASPKDDAFCSEGERKEDG